MGPHFLLGLIVIRKLLSCERRAWPGVTPVDWEGRSKRVRKPPPVTYWEEFVATDEWYLNKLTADVPEDEWKAAVEDDVSDAQTATDPSYSSDEDQDEDENDASDGSDEGGDDWTAELVADGDDASDDECSDECSDVSSGSSVPLTN